MLTLVILSFVSILPHNLAAPLHAKAVGNNPNSYPPITPTSSGSSDNTDNQPQYHGTGSNSDQHHSHGSDGSGNANGHHSTGSNSNQHHEHDGNGDSNGSNHHSAGSNSNQHHSHGDNDDGSDSEDDSYSDDGSGSEDDNNAIVEITQ